MENDGEQPMATENDEIALRQMEHDDNHNGNPHEDFFRAAHKDNANMVTDDDTFWCAGNQQFWENPDWEKMVNHQWKLKKAILKRRISKRQF